MTAPSIVQMELDDEYLVTLVERFWAKVRHAANGCAEWQAAHDKDGYGWIKVAGKQVYAHRISWLLATGKWPAQKVLHRCDNPPCVRFDHLFEGDNQANMDDMVQGRSLVGDLNPSRMRPETRPRGEAVVTSKLTATQVVEIRERNAAGESQKDLAASFGVSNQLISVIVRREYWRHV